MHILNGQTSRNGAWEVYTEGEHDPSITIPRSAFVGDDAGPGQVLLALKETQYMTRPVVFTTVKITTGIPTDIWWLYRKYVAVSLNTTRFYGHRVQEGKDVWQLMWSQTLMSSLDHVAISLRSIGPASATSMHD